MTQKVFFDTDPGVDDALAIGLLLSQPIDLLGISTVAGNIDAERGAVNALALLEIAGRDDIPVAIGENKPVKGEFSGGVPHIHGADGCGNIGMTTTLKPVDTDGVQLLIDTVKAHPHEVDVIAVGPLTNLAVALQREPEIAELVKSVSIMGGAFWVPGNSSLYAEANLWNDVAAAEEVFAAPWSGFIAPLDATNITPFTAEHIKRLEQSGSQFCRTLSGMVDFYANFYLQKLGFYGCALHDPLAVAAALETVEPQIRTGQVTIDSEEATFGRTHLWKDGELVSTLPEDKDRNDDKPADMKTPPDDAGVWKVLFEEQQNFGTELVDALETLP